MIGTMGARALFLLLVAAMACGYDSPDGGYGAPPTSPPGAPPVEPPLTPSPINGLWTSSGSEPELLRISTEQLAKSATLDPATHITTPSATLFTLNSVAFDDFGAMWVASQDDSVLVGFIQGSLTSSRSRSAKIVIKSNARSLSAPSGLAFDPQNRLWVSNAETGTLVRYDAEQLEQGGSPAPAVVLANMGHPNALAFDAQGALWVADTRNHRLVKFASAKLEMSGSPTPDVQLSGASSSLEAPSGLAFDRSGRLWVTDPGRQTLVAYSAAQLAASGSPVPAVILAGTSESAGIPTGIAFDAEDDLWVVSGEGSLRQYDHTELAASGAPRPTITLRIQDRVLFWSIAFWPKPAGLPLN